MSRRAAIPVVQAGTGPTERTKPVASTLHVAPAIPHIGMVRCKGGGELIGICTRRTIAGSLCLRCRGLDKHDPFGLGDAVEAENRQAGLL